MIWCDKALWQCRYSYGLCLSEKEFQKQMRRMNIPVHQWPGWIGEHADASTHFLEHPDGHKAAIVCLGNQKLNGVQIAAVLVHEAVHIWQEHKLIVGEKVPGDESEAYAIQSISQRLMEAYVHQTAKRKKK